MKGGAMRYSLLIIIILFAISILNAQRAKPNFHDELIQLYTQEAYLTAEEKIKTKLAQATPVDEATYLLELGDLYLDKLYDYQKAESIYTLLLTKLPKGFSIAEIYYRLGLTYEKKEDFLKAAQMYEKVAIQYHKSPYAQDALDAIERCFRKNYQEVAAKVDNYAITRLEFEDRMALAPGSYDTPEKQEELLDQMINERILYCEALKRGYDKTSDVREQMREARKNSLLQNWYQTEIIGKVKISEKEKKNYYRKHKKEFIIPEEVRAKEIVVSEESLADSLYKVLVSVPEDYFDSLALNYSIAPSKKNYGDLGYFRRGVYPEEMEKVAFRLKPKGLSRPFFCKDKGGYVILKVIDYRPRIARTYKEVSSEIEHRLRGEKIEENFKKETDYFKSLYKINIFNNAFTDNLDTVALINELPITQRDINLYLSRIPPFYRSEFETPEGKKKILDQIILERTWQMELEKAKYWLKNNVFQQLSDIRRSNLINALKKDEIENKVIITDDDLQKEYQKNLEDYKVPKQFRIREIVVRQESLAREIHKLATVSKIPFDSLARTYSTAPSKRAGGDVGFFALGTKPQEIEKVVKKLKPGAISNVIHLNDTSYYLVKLEEVKEAYTKKLDDVKPVLQRKLRQKLEKERYETFIEELRKNYRIEKFLPAKEELKSSENGD
jgi:peptidyl-prolyl cis-trans isomerase C